MASLPFVRRLPARFVLFGDSITQFSLQAGTSGWGVLVANQYERKADVINRGFSGYNTRWALHIFDAVFREWSGTGTDSSHPQLLTVFFGANDASLPELNPQQHVPLDEYERNIGELVERARRLFPTVSVLVISPPPIVESTWAEQCVSRGTQLNRKAAVTELYNQRCVAAATRAGVAVIDTHALFRSPGAPALTELLHDGLHLSATGNRLLADAVQATINREFPHLNASALPMHFPLWRDVDNAAPAALLCDAPEAALPAPAGASHP